MFLPPDAPLDAWQKRLHLCSKRIMDIFGASINAPFSNIWLLTTDKTEIIYDHGVPDFALIMPANTDYTQTPWVKLGVPGINPERTLRWTPPLFDPVPKSWMVSAVLPVDVNGRWIGMIGHVSISITFFLRCSSIVSAMPGSSTFCWMRKQLHTSRPMAESPGS